MKTLTIIRGLPGSGKSSLVTLLRNVYTRWFEADQYFNHPGTGVYEFDASKLGIAHKHCFDNTERSLKDSFDVIVSNTFTTEKEIKPYKELAEKYDAKFISIIVENRHGNKSVHDVPTEIIDKMRDRFSIKL